MDRGTWWATVLGIAELDMTERTCSLTQEAPHTGNPSPVKRGGLLPSPTKLFGETSWTLHTGMNTGHTVGFRDENDQLRSSEEEA